MKFSVTIEKRVVFRRIVVVDELNDLAAEHAAEDVAMDPHFEWNPAVDDEIEIVSIVETPEEG